MYGVEASKPDLLIRPASLGDLECSIKSVGSRDSHTEYALVASTREGFCGGFSVEVPLSAKLRPWWFLFPGYFYGTGEHDPIKPLPSLGKPSNGAVSDWADRDFWRRESWDFALDRASYPILLAWARGTWVGMSWNPHYSLSAAEGEERGYLPQRWGDCEPQIGAGMTYTDRECKIRVNVPASEGPICHSGCIYCQAKERMLRLKAGETLTLSFRVWRFAGNRHGYQQVIENEYRRLRSAHPAAHSEVAPEKLAETAVRGILDWHWVDDPGYTVYTASFDRSAEYNANNKGTTLGWHFEASGFVGGFPVAYGLWWYHVRTGDVRAGSAAEKIVDRYCREGATDWGLFRTSYHPGPARTPNGDFPNPAPAGTANDDPAGRSPFYSSCWLGNQSLVHARTTADACHYLARFVAIVPESNPRRSRWLAALRRAVVAALDLQEPGGRFGQIYDIDNRLVLPMQGAGGLLWIPALHYSSKVLADDIDLQRRIERALRMAGEGYAKDVESESICGAPEDAGNSPTSEDGYNALMAYAVLHRRFGGSRWLELLERAGDWTLTWRKAYNVRFSPKSILGAYDLRTQGGDFAGAGNNHLHVYGLCCLADLYYLSKVTGNPYYSSRADDHAAFAEQLLCMEPGQWNGQRGMMAEQVYTSDWSIWGAWDPTPAHMQKGSLMGFSHVWTINMILLGLEQRELAERMGWRNSVEADTDPKSPGFCMEGGTSWGSPIEEGVSAATNCGVLPRPGHATFPRTQHSMSERG